MSSGGTEQRTVKTVTVQGLNHQVPSVIFKPTEIVDETVESGNASQENIINDTVEEILGDNTGGADILNPDVAKFNENYVANGYNNSSLKPLKPGKKDVISSDFKLGTPDDRATESVLREKKCYKIARGEIARVWFPASIDGEMVSVSVCRTDPKFADLAIMSCGDPNHKTLDLDKTPPGFSGGAPVLLIEKDRATYMFACECPHVEADQAGKLRPEFNKTGFLAMTMAREKGYVDFKLCCFGTCGYTSKSPAKHWSLTVVLETTTTRYIQAFPVQVVAKLRRSGASVTGEPSPRTAKRPAADQGCQNDQPGQRRLRAEAEQELQERVGGEVEAIQVDIPDDQGQSDRRFKLENIILARSSSNTEMAVIPSPANQALRARYLSACLKEFDYFVVNNPGMVASMVQAQEARASHFEIVLDTQNAVNVSISEGI